MTYFFDPEAHAAALRAEAAQRRLAALGRTTRWPRLRNWLSLLRAATGLRAPAKTL